MHVNIFQLQTNAMRQTETQLWIPHVQIASIIIKLLIREKKRTYFFKGKLQSLKNSEWTLATVKTPVTNPKKFKPCVKWSSCLTISGQTWKFLLGSNFFFCVLGILPGVQPLLFKLFISTCLICTILSWLTFSIRTWKVFGVVFADYWETIKVKYKI